MLSYTRATQWAIKVRLLMGWVGWIKAKLLAIGDGSMYIPKKTRILPRNF